MAAMSSISIAEIKRDLLYASKECSDRGLVHSAKWSAELSFSLPSFQMSNHLPQTDYSDPQFVQEYDAYCWAKTLLDCKEYDRAAFFLESCKSHKAYFLYAYAKYLSGAKHQQEEIVDVIGPQETVRNKALVPLRIELSKRHKELDGFGLYLYGLVLKKLDLKKDALAVLEEAVNAEPLHWGGWLELASLCTSKDMLQNLKLPGHWMQEFFVAHVALEVQTSDDSIQQYANLSAAGFGESYYILLQTALANYQARDFDAAVGVFAKLQKKDPYSLEQIDTYSNILYVKEMKPELNHLAHHACQVDKYCEETCCVIGNYYSLQGLHEKAIVYFQRALKLNRQYTSAWTLMGHEFMELKNPTAAIESYRKAVGMKFGILDNCRH